MKLQYTGSDYAAQELWKYGLNKEEFIGHIYAHTQVAHDLDEAILVDTQGNMNLLTVYGSDGTIKVVGGELGDTDSPISAIASTFGDLKQFDDSGRGSRKWYLEDLFDDVFLSSIQHGLLLHKAVEKACEAVEGIEQIEAARNRVVSAQLDKEFGNDAG